MANADIVLIQYLMVGAFMATALPVLITVLYNLFCKGMGKKRKSANIIDVLLTFGFLALAIFLIRYAMGYFTIASPLQEGADAPAPMLNKTELAIKCLFMAVETFGMGEAYEPYILELRQMLDVLIPAGAEHGGIMRNLVTVYATFLHVIAPVASGAVILKVLASIFPIVRLYWSHSKHWREKCYFNELSPASLELAKSLNTYYVKVLRKAKPVLIFANAAADAAEGSESELAVEAKQLGAICVRGDLTHIPKPFIGRRNYFLMGENEFANMQTLTDLTEGRNVRYVKKAHIYLFVQTDNYVQLEQQVRMKLSGKGVAEKDLPLLVPVNAYRNLVHNLLADVPLYEPLRHKEDPTKLTVTILGNGLIGTETFLGTYWFGQMMVSGKTADGRATIAPCRLTVNVVSKDTPGVFWSKIDYINPEIRSTVKVAGETGEKKHLRYNDAGAETAPYCTVNYVQADVKVGSFWDPQAGDTASLLESDYFVVALGNDSDNISVAQKLRSFISQKHWQNRSQAKTVVAYAVFNPQLSSVLNNKGANTNGSKTTDVYMHAFGNLEQVYSSNNVFMANSLVLAEETGNAYLEQRSRNAHIKENLKRAKGENQNYNHWANIARTLHIKYKVFSLGWITTSVFDTEEQTHRANVKELCADYRRIASLNSTAAMNATDRARQRDMELKKHCLAWVEHRRWCAFTRTMGYQTTDALVENLLAYGGYKNMPLKLHPCLVEARLPELEGDNTYIIAKFRENGKIAKADTFRADTQSVLRTENGADYLDKLSYGWKKILEESRKSQDACLREQSSKADYYDFKLYDYYRYEFADSMLLSEFVAWNQEAGAARFPQLCDLTPAKICKRLGIKNAIPYTAEQGADFIVSMDCLHSFIRRHCKEVSEEKAAFCFDDTWYAFKKQQKAERKKENA